MKKSFGWYVASGESMKKKVSLCCTHECCHHVPLTIGSESAVCPNGHVFNFAPGTKITIFQSLTEGESEYASTDAAIKHDNAFRWLYKTFKTDEKSVRQSLVNRLNIQPGMRILIVGAGSCEDLPFVSSSLQGKGEIHCQDISAHMLLEGVKRYGVVPENEGITTSFSVSDVKSLPFQDQTFDCAYHFGGVNVFGDIHKGLSEINRVVVDGGSIVISDEGVAPWLQHTEFGRMMTVNNPLYGSVVPMDSLPSTVTQAEISWILQGCFYVVHFKSSHRGIDIDIDVPHVGLRGGSIRTRYYGQLEGVHPETKAKIYAEAQRRNLSRVEFLEELLLQGLNQLPKTDSDAQ